MKTIVLANQKGGVGKSAVCVQLAYFFHVIMGKRVLVIDLDHQHNSSKALKTGGLATVSQMVASRLLTHKVSGVEDAEFVLRSLIVANTTPRYIIKTAALAIVANC